MAIQLNKTIKGYDYNYWKIVRINYLVNGSAEIYLGLFKDRDIAQSLGNNVDMFTFIMDIPKEVYIEGNVYEYIYKYIETLPEFEGCLPC